tara:strand:- start:14582 stop:15511 length:930 start_codon:yes stop_codon:yes gene_type:complete
MYKKHCFIALFLFLFFNLGFTQNGLIQSNNSYEFFNEKALLLNIETLSSNAFEGRRTGTNGAQLAKDYIVDQFELFNVLPLTNKFEQSFAFFRRGKKYIGTNILGVVKGSEFQDKYIVISAHYDHEGIKNGVIYNGADDDASGTCALFSFAEYLEKNPPEYSVILAAFDGEEWGLQGSNYFVNYPVVPLEKIVLNLNMDMISRSGSNTLFAVGTRFNKILKEVILNFKQTGNAKLVAAHDGEDGLEDWTYSSDQGSFHKKGIPFIYFGVDDHKDYHMPTDDFENIQPKFYIESVKNIISVFNTIDTLTF